MARRWGDIEDAAQAVRLKLLVGPRPALLPYTGRGSLQGWVSVAAAREWMREARRAARFDRGDPSDLAETLVAVVDVHASAERSEAREILFRELRAAVCELAPRTRLLLRLHICDGRTIDDLAQMYRVHRATASRRLKRARRELARSTRERIATRYGLSAPGVNSLLHVVRSSFESMVQTFLLT